MPDDPQRSRSEYLLQLQHVAKTYGGLRALNDVSFGIRYAEVHCLVGENGSGKSALIKIISAVDQADSAQILFNHPPFPPLPAPTSILPAIQAFYQSSS